MFRSRMSSNALLIAKSVSRFSRMWKDVFFSPSFPESKLILIAFGSASFATFNKGLSILSAQMRLASFYKIFLICAQSSGWFRNIEIESGTGVVLCSGMGGRLSFFDLKTRQAHSYRYISQKLLRDPYLRHGILNQLSVWLCIEILHIIKRSYTWNSWCKLQGIISMEPLCYL